MGPRENWMIYGGPGFLAGVWLGYAPYPLPPSRQQVVSLFQSCWILCVAGGAYRRWGWMLEGRRRIIRRRQTMVLYKSFSTLFRDPLQRQQNQLGFLYFFLFHSLGRLQCGDKQWSSINHSILYSLQGSISTTAKTAWFSLLFLIPSFGASSVRNTP